MENSVLNSWKEIANYTGRGIRTLQRWERELGFPVRRPRGKQRSAVIAIRQEIDLWMRTPHGAEAARKAHHISVETHTRLLSNAETLRLRASTLRNRSEALVKRVARAMELSTAMQTSFRAAQAERKSWVADLSEKPHQLKKNVAEARDVGSPIQNSPPPRETSRKAGHSRPIRRGATWPTLGQLSFSIQSITLHEASL